MKSKMTKKKVNYYVSTSPETDQQFLVEEGKDGNIIELNKASVRRIKALPALIEACQLMRVSHPGNVTEVPVVCERLAVDCRRFRDCKPRLSAAREARPETGSVFLSLIGLRKISRVVRGNPAREEFMSDDTVERSRTFTSREIDTIIAALRLWQRVPANSKQPMLAEIANEHGDALTVKEVDYLIEKIQFN